MIPTGIALGVEVCTLGWDTPMQASSFSKFFATLSFSSLLPWDNDAGALPCFWLITEACSLFFFIFRLSSKLFPDVMDTHCTDRTPPQAQV